MDDITSEKIDDVKTFWEEHKAEIILGASVVVSTVVLNAVVTKKILNNTRVQIDWRVVR